MKYIFDYVEENKSKSFFELPLTEIDNVIFSRLVYLDYSAFVEKTLKEIANNYTFTKKDDAKLFGKTLLLSQELLKSVAETERYGDIIVTDFKEISSVDYATSFCAAVFKIKNDISFIAFRGTDSKIMSFYEDAELAYSFPIPSQVAALRYTRDILKKQKGTFYLGGHSKGGNLALFSYVFLDEADKKRIIKVFNNDGPGFPKDIVKILVTPEINEKIINIVPEDSIIGRLFESGNTYVIIKSSATGGPQHNVFTWIVNENKFERAENFGPFSEFIDANLEDSLKIISLEDMKEITQSVYNIAVQNGITSAESINFSNLKNMLISLREAAKAEEETANEATIVAKTLIKNLFNSISINKLPLKLKQSNKENNV